jgi:anti-sigma factor RsiW
MNRPIDPQLERMINRHLDGQLPEARRPTLYRELLKNPAARQTLEDYEANDRLAAEALAAVIPPVDRETVPNLDGDLEPNLPFPAERRYWLSQGAALAAAVVFLVAGVLAAWTLSHAPGNHRVALRPANGNGSAPPVVKATPVLAGSPVAPVSHGPLIVDVGAPAAPPPGAASFIGLFDTRDQRWYVLEAPRDDSGQSADLGDI